MFPTFVSLNAFQVPVSESRSSCRQRGDRDGHQFFESECDGQGQGTFGPTRGPSPSLPLTPATTTVFSLWGVLNSFDLTLLMEMDLNIFVLCEDWSFSETRQNCNSATRSNVTWNHSRILRDVATTLIYLSEQLTFQLSEIPS